MRKFIISFSAAAVVVAASATLVAQRPDRPERGPRPEVSAEQGPRRGGGGRVGPDRPGPGGPAGMLGLGPRLNLTEEQRAKVETIVRDSRDKTGPIADELRLTQSTLRRELFADQRNSGRITELSNKVAQLEKQLADARLQTSLAISDLLTPEQRQQMRAGVGAGRGGFGGPGRGFGAQGRGFGRG